MSEGEVAAGRAIDYGKLRADLQRLVGRLCPAWLSSQRDDLVQAAVMRVMQAAGTEAVDREGIRPLTSSYMYKVAHSALVDEIRRVRRRHEADLTEKQIDQTADAHRDLSPERAAASQEIGRGIQQCLAAMSRERRLAVTLYLQGHTVPEASRLLDWTLKRTENLVYRGLADLRECLLAKGMRP